MRQKVVIVISSFVIGLVLGFNVPRAVLVAVLVAVVLRWGLKVWEIGTEQVLWTATVRQPDGTMYSVEKTGRWQGGLEGADGSEREARIAPPEFPGWVASGELARHVSSGLAPDQGARVVSRVVIDAKGRRVE